MSDIGVSNFNYLFKSELYQLKWNYNYYSQVVKVKRLSDYDLYHWRDKYFILFLNAHEQLECWFDKCWILCIYAIYIIIEFTLSKDSSNERYSDLFIKSIIGN